MSEDEGPQPGYAGRHYCLPLVTMLGFLRLPAPPRPRPAEDLDYIRLGRPDPGHCSVVADERTYADVSATGV